MVEHTNSEIADRLGRMNCVMVEVCVPHHCNPSPHILPVERAKLIAALRQPPSDATMREALVQIARTDKSGNPELSPKAIIEVATRALTQGKPD